MNSPTYPKYLLSAKSLTPPYKFRTTRLSTGKHFLAADLLFELGLKDTIEALSQEIRELYLADH